MLPSVNRQFKLEAMENKDGQSVDVAPGSGHVMHIPFDADVSADYGLLMKQVFVEK
jgi:U32 family peptidase